MNDLELIAILVLLGTIFASRFVSDRGLATLLPEEKLRVADALAAERRYSWLVVIALVCVWFAFADRLSGSTLLAFGLYSLGALAYSVAKLRRLGLPRTYVRYYSAGRLIQLCGLVLYLVAIGRGRVS